MSLLHQVAVNQLAIAVERCLASFYLAGMEQLAHPLKVRPLSIWRVTVAFNLSESKIEQLLRRPLLLGPGLAWTLGHLNSSASRKSATYLPRYCLMVAICPPTCVGTRP